MTGTLNPNRRADRTLAADRSCRPQDHPHWSETLEEFARKPYIGRRTSIGSVERDDATLLFNILDDLQDYADPQKTKVNLVRLKKHLHTMYGGSRLIGLGEENR